MRKRLKKKIIKNFLNKKVFILPGHPATQELYEEGISQVKVINLRNINNSRVANIIAEIEFLKDDSHGRMQRVHTSISLRYLTPHFSKFKKAWQKN